MKFRILLIFFGLAIISCSTHCKQNLTPENFTIVGKWEDMESDDAKPGAAYIEFKQDGTWCNSYVTTGKCVNDNMFNWAQHHDTLVLTADGEQIKRVMKIEGSVLKMTNISQSDSTVIYLRRRS